MSMRVTGNQASLIGCREDPEFTWFNRSRSLKAGLFFPRPYAMPPGVPRDRVRAMEAAFLKTLNDPEFVAEAEKTRMSLNPIPGTTLHNMIVEGLSMPRPSKKSSSRSLRRRVSGRAGRYFGIRSICGEFFSRREIPRESELIELFESSSAPVRFRRTELRGAF